jgi:hypothetical protein
LRAGDGFLGRAQDFDFTARFAGHAFGFGDDGRVWLETSGRRDAQVRAGAGADGQKLLADIIAVADVGEF